MVVGNYIKFGLHHREANRKTDIWSVFATASEVALGQIRFHGAWRKFCFFPAPNTMFDAGCLREIEKFCEDQTSAWRNL